MKPEILGTLYETKGGKFKQGHAAVYDPNYIAPTLVTACGGVINLLF